MGSDQSILRPATPDDAQRIAELLASLRGQLTFDATADGAHVFADSLAAPALRANLEAPNFAHFVAEHDGELLGVVALRDHTHLFHLFVAAPHQGRGLARRLWDAARQHAESHGQRGDFTVNSSPIAQPVYERFGFAPTGPSEVKHGVTFIPMQRPRDSSSRA